MSLTDRKTRKNGQRRSQFRLNPKRQAFFVGLALAGIGIGYGIGFVLKKEPAPQAVAKIVAAVKTPAVEKKPAAVKPAPLRLYEEPLPQEIIENPAATPEVPTPEVPTPEVTDEPPKPPEPEPEAPQEVKKEPEPVVTPVVKTRPKPKIVIVIDDLGIDKPRTARFINLPGPLTLSFMSYANGLKKQTAAAKNAGHELWMHIPMEPGSADVDPGPNVLLTGIPRPELLASINWNLEQFSGYVGVNNHMGSRFTADLPGLKTVMEELKKRNLLFLDSVTSGKSIARKAARETGVPFRRRNIFLDHQDDAVGIERRLAEVERLALKKGIAIAIGHPREKTLTVLGPWLKGLAAKGFKLVALSKIYEDP